MRLFVIVALSLGAGLQVFAQSPSAVGHPRGTVVLASAQTPVILTRFIELAGGADSPIVFVPTAALNKPGGPQIGFASSNPPETALKAQGAKNVTVIHTFDRTVADSDTFVEPLTHARAVWFAGGMPEYLLDSYAGTKVVAELRKVLERGGEASPRGPGRFYTLRGGVAPTRGVIEHERAPRALRCLVD